MRVRPDVSVVVIAYNDAERLPHAVASALAQSLGAVETVIVDDGSTDGTAEAADRLAAAHPGRVRAVHLASNSGGCGRPRNRGVEASAGRYLMFLDSDDLLDRHACLNLLAAAEDTGADIVSGLCDRIFLDLPAGAKGRVRPWYPWLYQRSAVYESLGDNPNLLYDTLSTNKAYRRGSWRSTACGSSSACTTRTCCSPPRPTWRRDGPRSSRTASTSGWSGRGCPRRRSPTGAPSWPTSPTGWRSTGASTCCSRCAAPTTCGGPRTSSSSTTISCSTCASCATATPATGRASSTWRPPTWTRWTRGSSRRPTRCPRSPPTWSGRAITRGARRRRVRPRQAAGAPRPARRTGRAGLLGRRPAARRARPPHPGRHRVRVPRASPQGPPPGEHPHAAGDARRARPHGRARAQPAGPDPAGRRAGRLAGVPRPAPPGAAGTGPRVDPARGRPARLAGRVRPGPADPADRDHRPGVGRAAAPAGGRRGGGHPPRRGPRIAVPRRGRAARQAAVDEVRRRPAPPLRHRGGHLAFALETGARGRGSPARPRAAPPGPRRDGCRGAAAGGWGAACGGR